MNKLLFVIIFVLFGALMCSSSSTSGNNENKDEQINSEVADVIDANTETEDTTINTEVSDSNVEEIQNNDVITDDNEVSNPDTDVIVDIQPEEINSDEINDEINNDAISEVESDEQEIVETDTESDEINEPEIITEINETVEETEVEDPCDLCNDKPIEEICGIVNSGDKIQYIIYDNLCYLECDPLNAEVANCKDKGVSPVCDVNKMKDYDNACFAGCDGAQSWVAGDCSCKNTECTKDDKKDNPFCGIGSTGSQTVCKTYSNKCEWICDPDQSIYSLSAGVCAFDCEWPENCKGTFADPVCGKDGKTYPNYCVLAQGSDTDIYSPGACLSDYPGIACEPSDDAYVCGSDPDTGKWKTYMNECVVDSLGATKLFDDQCCDFDNELHCDPFADDPVCTINLYTNKWETVSNPCIVDCVQYYDETKYYEGECVCCNDSCCDLTNVSPVCGMDGQTYTNECAMNCAGTTKDHDGKCVCPDTFDPVCCSDGSTYGNACIAKSLFKQTDCQPGECQSCKDICDNNDFGPGCGTDGISYPNYCVLWKCHQYTNLIECNNDDDCPDFMSCKLDDDNSNTSHCRLDLICKDSCSNCD